MSVIGHGVDICTSTTRPTPISGSLIYETDTQKLMLWDGSSWVTPMNLQSAGGMLSGTYPNPNVASISGLAAGGGLSGTYPNPSIASPMLANHFAWGAASTNFPSGVSNSVGVSLNVPFKSSVLARFISTGFVTSTGLFTQYARIDGITGWYNIGHYYHNTTFDHRTYPAGVIGITLNPGNYVFRAYTAGASTDSADRLNVSIVCRAVA